MNSMKKIAAGGVYQKKRLSSGTIRHVPNRQTVKRRQSMQITQSIQPRCLTTHLGKRQTTTNNYLRQNKLTDRAVIKNLKKQHRSIQEKFLLQKSDRMKLVYLSNDTQLFFNIIVMAVDFIINEDSFWNDQNIKHTIIKDWKNLTKNKNIYWIIRRQSTLEKLKEFSSVYQLRLDGVFLVKRKNNYLVDYTPVIQNLSQTLKTNPKTHIIIIECIKINEKDICSYQSYRGRIPIILTKNINIKIALIRTGQCDGLQKPIQNINRFILNKQGIFKSPQLSTNIPQYINLYIKNADWNKKSLKRQKLYKTQSDFDDQYDQIQGNIKLQQFKKELISTIIQLYGRDYKIQGNSIYYIVGDMIKRNYKLLTKQMGRIYKKENILTEKINQCHKKEEQTLISKQLISINYLKRLKVELKYYEL